MSPLYIGGPIPSRGCDYDAYAQMHLDMGYRAAYCPDIPSQDSEAIRAVREAFSKAGVIIAEVGAWVNLMDSDMNTRAQHLEYVTSRLALAEEVGARCCVDIAGSLNATQWDGPCPANLSRDYFDLAVENARKIIDAVNPKTAKFAYEMMPWALPDSPESNLDLIKAVDRSAFGVHLDPVNIINSPARYYDTGAVISDCFRVLGPWIVSCHAKDILMSGRLTVHLDEVRPGLGALNYDTYLLELARLTPSPPLMLEHLANAEEYDLAKTHIFGVAGRLNLEH